MESIYRFKKNTIWAFLTIMVVLCGVGVGVAQAGQGDPVKPSPVVSESMALKNEHYKGLASPHSNRKEAAKRLKVAHLQEEDHKHQGVNANPGQNGEGTHVHIHQKTVNQGGV